MEYVIVCHRADSSKFKIHSPCHESYSVGDTYPNAWKRSYNLMTIGRISIENGTCSFFPLIKFNTNTYREQRSPEVQNRGISDPTKRTYVLQKSIKKRLIQICRLIFGNHKIETHYCIRKQYLIYCWVFGQRFNFPLVYWPVVMWTTVNCPRKLIMLQQ